MNECILFEIKSSRHLTFEDTCACAVRSSLCMPVCVHVRALLRMIMCVLVCLSLRMSLYTHKHAPPCMPSRMCSRMPPCPYACVRLLERVLMRVCVAFAIVFFIGCFCATLFGGYLHCVLQVQFHRSRRFSSFIRISLRSFSTKVESFVCLYEWSDGECIAVSRAIPSSTDTDH